AGGAKGRKAALRGAGCYLLGSAAGNLPKPLFGRPQPRHRWVRKPQVIRGSFPSGHACAEVAFVFGAAQEAPMSLLPFGTMAMLAHLSLTRDGKHYVADTLAGGTLGVLIAALVGRRWPTDVTRRIGLSSSPGKA
ncbi:MAG: phosphatase PAP2 family protein, partial [Actinomycetota bacterium]